MTTDELPEIESGEPSPPLHGEDLPDFAATSWHVTAPPYSPPPWWRQTIECIGWCFVILGVLLLIPIAAVAVVVEWTVFVVGPPVGLIFALYDLARGGDHLLLDIALLVLCSPWWVAMCTKRGRWMWIRFARLSVGQMKEALQALGATR